MICWLLQIEMSHDPLVEHCLTMASAPAATDDQTAIQCSETETFRVYHTEAYFLIEQKNIIPHIYRQWTYFSD